MIMVEMLACWLKNDRAPRLIPSKDLLSRVKDGNKLCARVEVAAGQVGQLLVRVRLHLLLMNGPIFFRQRNQVRGTSSDKLIKFRSQPTKAKLPCPALNPAACRCHCCTGTQSTLWSACSARPAGVQPGLDHGGEGEARVHLQGLLQDLHHKRAGH